MAKDETERGNFTAEIKYKLSDFVAFNKTKNPHKAGSVNYQFQAYLLRLLPSSRL